MFKTKKSTILIISIAFVLAFSALVITCINADIFTAFKQDGVYVNLYFLDSQKTNLVTEQRLLTSDQDPTDIKMLLEMLMAGPKNTIDYTAAIPHDTRIISVKKENNLVAVNLSSEFYSDSSLNDVLAAATIINTLCDTAVVNRVKILVEGKELIENSKLASGFLSKDDIIYGSGNTQQDAVIISLYYPAADGSGLLLENRTVTPKDKEPLVLVAMNELLKGTQNSNAVNIIPSTTKLLSTELNDKICFVNLSKEFVDNHTAGSSAELMTIYSIVNTLTEIDDVNKVQFLIEGKKVDQFGEILFSDPFEREESYIKK